jgi:hypothetical protein
MATFSILKGRALGKAIVGQGKLVANFTQREHQLAVSCLMHVEEHSCPSHLNSLLAVTPANYRAGLKAWAVAFGKVKFNPETLVFDYNGKGETKVADMMGIAPANYIKETRAGNSGEKALDEIKELTAFIKKMTEKGASIRVVEALKGALRLAETPAVVTLVPAKPKKAKTEKTADAA